MNFKTLIQNDLSQLWLESPYTIKEHDGDIYILNAYHNFVKFSKEGKPLKTWRTFADDRDGGWHGYPLDFAITKKGEILLLDMIANKVVVSDKDGTELRQWGLAGNGPGEFDFPTRISLDRDEHVFILDKRNKRVQKYDADGTYLAQWEIGEDPNNFVLLPDGSFWLNYGKVLSFFNATTQSFQNWDVPFYIYHMDVDSDQHLYVLGDEAVSIFRDGELIRLFEPEYWPTSLMGFPFKIDSSNHLLMVNSLNSTIIAMDREGQVVAEYGTDPRDYQLVQPFGVAVSEDAIFVSDVFKKNVLVFDKAGNFKNSWGRTGKIPFEFHPKRIMYHGDVLYVAAQTSVFKFTAGGECIGQFGVEGNEPGQFKNARAIACDSEGFLYVADEGNNRIQKFTAEGDYVLHWSTEGLGIDEFSTPEDVAVDSEDTVYVLDPEGATVMFTKEGKLIRVAVNSLAVGQPQCIAIGAEGNFFIGEKYGVRQFEYEGLRVDGVIAYGSGESQFHDVSGIAVKDGLVYVADTLNRRVQVTEVK